MNVHGRLARYSKGGDRRQIKSVEVTRATGQDKPKFQRIHTDNKNEYGPVCGCLVGRRSHQYITLGQQKVGRGGRHGKGERVEAQEAGRTLGNELGLELEVW